MLYFKRCGRARFFCSSLYFLKKLRRSTTTKSKCNWSKGLISKTKKTGSHPRSSPSVWQEVHENRRQPSCWILLPLKQHIWAAWFPQELFRHLSHRSGQVAMVSTLGSQPAILSCCSETCWQLCRSTDTTTCFSKFSFLSRLKTQGTSTWSTNFCPGDFFQGTERYNPWELHSWTVKDCNALRWQRTTGILSSAKHW